MFILSTIVSNEALNAIIIAVVGALSAAFIARYTAKRQALRDDNDTFKSFRGELQTDNMSLRQELRDVKEERDRMRERIDRLETELRRQNDIRMSRQASDAEATQQLRKLQIPGVEQK
jgi:predicted nuclease with TOPRIM domain